MDDAALSLAPRRPRRRFEEIDRAYTCSWPGCAKSYGTLSHLNDHVRLQAHGPKREPGEFRDLRRKRRQARKFRREPEQINPSIAPGTDHSRGQASSVADSMSTHSHSRSPSPSPFPPTGPLVAIPFSAAIASERSAPAPGIPQLASGRTTSPPYDILARRPSDASSRRRERPNKPVSATVQDGRFGTSPRQAPRPQTVLDPAQPHSPLRRDLRPRSPIPSHVSPTLSHQDLRINGPSSKSLPSASTLPVSGPYSPPAPPVRLPPPSTDFAPLPSCKSLLSAVDEMTTHHRPQERRPVPPLMMPPPASPMPPSHHQSAAVSEPSPGQYPYSGYGSAPSPATPGHFDQRPAVQRQRRRAPAPRPFSCNFPRCLKSYATLKHLNEHVTVQRHGPKRTRNEFPSELLQPGPAALMEASVQMAVGRNGQEGPDQLAELQPHSRTPKLEHLNHQDIDAGRRDGDLAFAHRGSEPVKKSPPSSSISLLLNPPSTLRSLASSTVLPPVSSLHLDRPSSAALKAPTPPFGKPNLHVQTSHPSMTPPSSEQSLSPYTSRSLPAIHTPPVTDGYRPPASDYPQFHPPSHRIDHSPRDSLPPFRSPHHPNSVQSPHMAVGMDSYQDSRYEGSDYYSRPSSGRQDEYSNGSLMPVYVCTWPGCGKQYGRLGNLNTHILMQKHGERRHAQDFKPEVSSDPYQGNSNGSNSSDGQLADIPDLQMDLNQGQTRKRYRRSYSEIERLYACTWPGCTKSYGTLNHLNNHISLQEHGPKREASEFKELRKVWRQEKMERRRAERNALWANTLKESVVAPTASSGQHGQQSPPQSSAAMERGQDAPSNHWSRHSSPDSEDGTEEDDDNDMLDDSSAHPSTISRTPIAYPRAAYPRDDHDSALRSTI